MHQKVIPLTQTRPGNNIAQKNKPDGVNMLSQLLERVAALEAEVTLLKISQAALQQEVNNVGLSHEAVEALTEYTISKIHMRLTPLSVLQEQAKKAAQAQEEAAKANEHPDDSDSEAGSSADGDSAAHPSPD